MAGQTDNGFCITLSPRAEKQWQKILAFYAERNQSLEYSLKLDEKLQELLDILCVKYSTPGELTSRRKTRRMSFEKRFAVFFRIKQNRIEVTSIVDARQNVQIY